MGKIHNPKFVASGMVVVVSIWNKVPPVNATSTASFHFPDTKQRRYLVLLFFLFFLFAHAFVAQWCPPTHGFLGGT